VALTKLKQIREDLGVSQEVLVRRTKSVTLRTYSRIESGKSAARHDTATQIFEAVNEIRREAGKPEMNMEDLELRLY
jgi:predicted transcriptional regulator